MPPTFEERVAWEERWAEGQPEPERSHRLKFCAYERAECAFGDRFPKPDADPKACSMYLDIMVDAVSWWGIGNRWMMLRPILGMRWDFEAYHPKKRLKGKSGFFRLLFAALKGPFRGEVPFISASEMEEIRRLTRTPESEERIAWARSCGLPPAAEYKPVRVLDEHELAAIDERQRKVDTYEKAERSAFLSQYSGDEKECERQLDIMVQAIREFKHEPWYRYRELLEVWMLRHDFRTKHPTKRLGGKSRFFCLVIELLRGPWRAPEHIRNVKGSDGQ